MFYMIPNSKDISKFNEELILPLEGYSIGFDIYFSALEIEEISKTRKVNVIINKFFHKKDIDSIDSVLEKLEHVNYFFIEDLGLINKIDKEKIVLSQNHIITNYDSINYFKEIGIKNVVVCNELTKEELISIREKTSSNLFYFFIARNNLMYSKRHLLSSFYEYKSSFGEKTRVIKEKVSGKELIIKEENDGTLIFDKNIFSANLYMKELSGYNFIINFSNMNIDETKVRRQ